MFIYIYLYIGYWTYCKQNLSCLCYIVYHPLCLNLGGAVMVFNVFSNNISVISWRSVLLVEENGVPGEKHRPRHEQGSNSISKTCHICVVLYITHCVYFRRYNSSTNKTDRHDKTEILLKVVLNTKIPNLGDISDFLLSSNM